LPARQPARWHGGTSHRDHGRREEEREKKERERKKRKEETE